MPPKRKKKNKAKNGTAPQHDSSKNFPKIRIDDQEALANDKTEGTGTAQTKHKGLPSEREMSKRLFQSVSGSRTRARSRSRSSTISYSNAKQKRVYGSIPPVVKTMTYTDWHKTMKDDICDLVQEEYATLFDRKGKLIDQEPIEDRKDAFNMLSERYLRYVLTYKKFDECYQFMVHPQKRLLLINCIEGVLARLLELKEEMVQVEQREFHFFDDILQIHGLTPDQIEMNVPELFSEFRARSFRNRKFILESILRRMKHFADGTGETDKNMGEESVYTREEAILLIQRNERCFRARRKKQELLKPYVTRMMIQKSKLADTSMVLFMSKLRHKYIRKWRVFVEKKRRERRQRREQLFLEMDSKPFQRIAAEASVNELRIRNKEKAFEYEDNYLNERAIHEEKMMYAEGPRLSWHFKYNIMQWLLETRDLLGKFPPFPEEEKGGSALLFSNKTVAEAEEEIREMLENTNGKGKGKKDKKDKDKTKKKKKDRKKKKTKKKQVDDDFNWVMPESASLPVLKQVANTYTDYWYYKNENHNIEQRHDEGLMKEEVFLRVAERIRHEVDNTLRRELENLTVAIEHAKRKKASKKDKKQKKEKKKKKRKKKSKDLTADRTIEELYEELVMKGIIKKTEDARIDDFIGSPSFIGCARQESGQEPMPSLVDVRRLVTEQIVLPLGSPVVHERSPLHRSFLIAGMRESGKHMLLNAICNETGANLFDLTPANLVGKYDDKEGRKMLMHLIMKVGKALEPSVFLVDHCEDMFLRKKVKGDIVKPQKWEKPLRKAIKKIKNGDRMMLIGITNSPYKAKTERMSKSFNRIIPVPRPDYGNRRALWQHFITKLLGQAASFPEVDLSTLTMVSSGFSAGAIKQVCLEVITAKRVMAIQRGFRLRAEEFVKRLAASDPFYLEEQQAFQDWYAKTPLAKRRRQRLGLDTGKKKKKGGKGKKKKKK